MPTTGTNETCEARRRGLVLVVDDEKAMLEIYTEILARLSVDVVADADPRIAARRFESSNGDGHFDMVLLDLRMPDLDGHELLRRIRQRHPDLPVVVVTGYPSRESAEWCRRLGVLHYIRKPFDPDDLLQRVRSVLHRKQDGQGATGAPTGGAPRREPRGE